MLELQKSFLLVKFFNQISCNKSLKAKGLKAISCFFFCFICLTPLGLESSSSRETSSFLTSHRLKKYKNQNPQSSKLKVNCRFLLVIRVKWKQSVCSITLLYSSTFYSLFLPFFVLEIFKFKYDTFFIRNSAGISKFDQFEQLFWGRGDVEDIIFWKPPGNFRFVTLPLQIPEKTSFHPWKYSKKPRPVEIRHKFLLSSGVTLNSYTFSMETH